MVNWDPGSRSAISDLEVEEREETDTLYSIRYSEDIVVATVRPETMLGDTAVAVHPDDERYRHLVGTTVTLPLVGRELPVIADEYVKMDFGTGNLKITPGHDPNDFEIGQRHGLESVSVIGEDGRMTEQAGAFAGMTALEAREAVVAELGDRVVATEAYTHNVPYSHRSGERIEPLISLQWFMAMDELAGPAIDVVRDGRVKIHPASQSRRYIDWLENIRRGASRASCGGATDPRLVPRRRGGPRRPRGAGGRGVDAGPRRPRHVVLGAGCGRSRRSAGPRTRRSCARSTRPTCSRRRATSCSCGSRGWSCSGCASPATSLRARLRPLGHPGAGRAPDVEVARHRHRPVGAHRGGEGTPAYGADAVRFGLLAMSSTQDVKFNEERVARARR
jgi:valyl-tRNA synthetase